MLEPGTAFLRLAECDCSRKRKNDAHAQCKLPTDSEDHDQCKEKQKNVLIHLINNKCYEMTDRIHITCLAA